MTVGYRGRTLLRHELEEHRAAYLCLNRLAHRPKLVLPKSKTTRFETIFGVDNLANVIRWLQRVSPNTRGTDGIRAAELTNRAVFEVARAMNHSLMEGTYQPGPPHHQLIPKRKSTEKRKITVRTLPDRTVSAALQFALRDLLDREFLPMSYGFRPRLGVWHLAAQLERDIRDTGFEFLLNVDARKAFDSVPRRYILDCLVPCISKSPRLTRLMETILLGDEALMVGIDQGGSFSPTLFNLAMHRLLDSELARHQPPLRHRYRFADNLAGLCCSSKEAEGLHEQLSQLLHAQGMTLKETVEDGTVHLRSESTTLLGLTLSAPERQLQLAADEDSWTELAEYLEEAHSYPDPPLYAGAICTSWASFLSPALPTVETTSERILDLLRTYDLREAISSKRLIASLRDSRRSWEKLRQETRGTVSMTQDTTRRVRSAPRSRRTVCAVNQ
jgi:hypothetical protein